MRSLFILKRILWVTLFYQSVSLFELLHFYVSAIQYEVNLNHWDYMVALRGSLITGTMSGIIGGLILTFLWEKWLRTKPYGWTLLNILLTYSIVFLLISFCFNVNYFGSKGEAFIFSTHILQLAILDTLSIETLVPYTFWLGLVLVTFITFQISDKYGPGVFKDFLLGKYFSPKREERVFMFLDLKSSTTIAEYLGESRYFQFLNDVLKTITPEILNHDGEIYQYVGDEVVISWKNNTNIENGVFIDCFFAIQKSLIKNLTYFQSTYDRIPIFKAGVHYGSVMAGELGVVKRDIVFSGDVLNTTSRIQNKCNELQAEILVSQHLVNKIKRMPEYFQPKSVGTIPLRGKSESLTLFTF